MGASYALNVLGIEPWVIAKQLRHSDDEALVIQLYGHPSRRAVMERMRRGWRGNVRPMPVPPRRALRLVSDEPRSG